jgi:hypothetical protein
VIGFYRIVRVLLDVVPRRGNQLLHDAGIDRRSVSDHLVWDVFRVLRLVGLGLKVAELPVAWHRADAAEWVADQEQQLAEDHLRLAEEVLDQVGRVFDAGLAATTAVFGFPFTDRRDPRTRPPPSRGHRKVSA